jgi:hypothetical protein
MVSLVRFFRAPLHRGGTWEELRKLENKSEVMGKATSNGVSPFVVVDISI